MNENDRIEVRHVHRPCEKALISNEGLFVSRPVHLFEMAFDGRAWIFRRFAVSQTRRQAFHHLVRIAGKEKRYGIALAAGSIDNPVHSRAEAIIGPARDQVAEVDDEGARDRGCMNPLALGLSLHLEAAHLILQRQRNAPESVRSRADRRRGFYRRRVSPRWGCRRSASSPQTEP